MTRRVTRQQRLDVALCERRLAPSRSRAQELVRDGRVTVNEHAALKASALVDETDLIAVREGLDFVSRGGRKLDGALDALAVDVADAIVADIGASTGGFTDCVLRRGARKVYAVDVGTDQLAQVLRDDARVVVREHTNARELRAEDFDEPIDVVVVDASFIGLGLLAPALARIVRPGGTLVALVKPQFEAGREAVRAGKGVIKDSEVRARAIGAAREALASAGFVVEGECDSPLPGPKGNVERFVRGTRR